MDENNWNNQMWIQPRKYPKGTSIYILLIAFISILLMTVIFFYHYPTYKTFYGSVEEDGNAVVKVMVSIKEIEKLQSAIKENKKVKLKKVESEIQIISGENMVSAYIVIPVSKKLLIKNNIIPIKLKVSSISLWEELKQKWKKGMNL